MFTIEELDEKLREIRFYVAGRYPNRYIYSPDNQRTLYRVLDDRIEFETNIVSSHYLSTCFYFKGADIEKIDNNAISIGNGSNFVLIGNHKMPM